MPQPLEKLNRVLKKMGGKGASVRTPASTSTSTSKQCQCEEARTNWKLVWMDVYDELRKECAKLRTENEQMQGLCDKTKENANRNRLLQEKIKEQWLSNDKKNERIRQLKLRLKELESAKSNEATVVKESGTATDAVPATTVAVLTPKVTDTTMQNTASVAFDQGISFYF